MAISRIQRWLVLSLLLLAAMASAQFWATRPAAALICALLPVWMVGVLLAIQFGLAALANRREPTAALGVVAGCRAWARECIASVRVFGLWQPFSHHAHADQLAAAPEQRGLVLVHGFCCNRALWTPWMRRLRAQGRPFVAVDLEPAFGSISSYAGIVEAAIERMTQATGHPPILVGHSMGGLAIRAWAAQCARNAVGLQRIHRIFTIATPHQGTALARLSASLNGAQMRLGSDWLARNHANLPSGFARMSTCFYSNGDNIVFPATAAALSGADNRLLQARGHVEMAFCHEVMSAVLAA